MKFGFVSTLALVLAGCAPPPEFVHSQLEVPALPGTVVHLEVQDDSFIEAIAAWNLQATDSRSPHALWRIGRRGADAMVWSDWTSINQQEPASPNVHARLDVDVITGRFDAVEFKLADQVQVSGSLSLTATASRRGERITPSRGTTIEIDVPHRSQKSNDSSLKGRLCSPASLAMICAYYGEDIDVATLANEAYDADHDIYGNWPRNLQAVHRLSGGRLTARFVRMSNFHELREFLEAGTPVVISVKGSITGAPYSPTGGHLLVARGITADGDIMVADPAFSEPAQARRIYKSSDLAHAWLVNRRGTAYVVTRKSQP